MRALDEAVAPNPSLDRAMQMAAKHAPDLRVAHDHVGEFPGVVQPDSVHMVDAGG